MKKKYFVMVKNIKFIEVSKFWFYFYVFGVFEQALIFALLWIIYITNLHNIWLYFNS